MEQNETNNNYNVPNNLAKKSKVFNVIIIVLILALIVVFAVSKIGKNAGPDVAPVDDTSTDASDNDASGSAGVFVPEPVGVWTESSIKNEITFDVPPNYYVSYPVIGECKDIVSISTQTSGAPTVPIALIYKDGCVTDTIVMSKYTYREVKNGYVFQTNSNSPSVVSLYNRIVASAEAK